MNSKSAIKALKEIGFVSRHGKGDHIVLKRSDKTIIIAGGKSELSSGMTAKVRGLLMKAQTNPREKGE